MDLTQISSFGRRHRMSNVSPALRITQPRASDQLHYLICCLNGSDRTIQELVDKWGSTSLSLLDDIFTIGFFALRAGNENANVLLMIRDTCISLTAVTLEFGAVMSAVSLIALTDLAFEPGKKLIWRQISVCNVFPVHTLDFQDGILFDDHDPWMLIVTVFGKKIFRRVRISRQFRADFVFPESLDDIDTSSA